MGKLDEAAFETTIASCPKCEAKAFEVASYIDRQVTVMLGERNDDGRWTHDGEKFIDGVYRVTCIRCRADAFTSADCPRCHRENGLADAVGHDSRLAVPKRCPTCKGTELTVSGFAPAMVRTGEGQRPSPTATAHFGDAGFHVAQIMCDGCDWVALAEGCPLCGGAGPLRARP
ncbi:MAG TPA: hypothetical protein VL326_00760 [Kofleriaceae bacterium]|jgi:hypothetical protein|nr:hypothetical protein [Kofleriaceae bacterium]